MATALIAAATVALAAAQQHAPPEAGPDPEMMPRPLWQLAMDGPAYVNVHDEDGEPVLIVSQFPLLGTNQVSKIDGLNALQTAEAWEAEPIAEITWPNEITDLSGLNADLDGFIISGGFMFAPGQVTVVETASGTEFELTGKRGVFYHRAEWVDADGDGTLDLITARANTPGFFPPGQLPTEFELVALIQPAADPLAPENLPWEEVVLDEGGADVHIDLHGDVIYSASFFSGRLEKYEKTGENWVDGVERVLIDDTLGSPFDVALVDMNMDGIEDLLVTNHEAVVADTAVFVFDGADNFATRHTISSGFPVRNNEPGQASPGQAIAFYPTDDHTRKPWAVLGGDAAWSAYIIYPLSEDPTDWSYGTREILAGAGTIGAIGVVDADGDGYTDLFVPDFDTGILYAMTFAPAPPAAPGLAIVRDHLLSVLLVAEAPVTGGAATWVENAVRVRLASGWTDWAHPSTYSGPGAAVVPVEPEPFDGPRVEHNLWLLPGQVLQFGVRFGNDQGFGPWSVRRIVVGEALRDRALARDTLDEVEVAL